MSSAEFAEWIAYERLEPWGPERMDAGFAILATLVSNLARRRGGRAYKPEDFFAVDWLPIYHHRQHLRDRRDGVKEKQSATEMQATLFAFAAAHGAKVE